MTDFLVDRMLGKTAKWLRLMGVDAKYAPEGPDKEILEIAENEGRVMITRDKEMADNDGVFLVPKKPANKIIPLILEKYDVDIKPMSRCSKCNSAVEEVERAEVEGSVPKGVLAWCNDYWRCTGCGKVYWKGTHWDRIMDEIYDMTTHI